MMFSLPGGSKLPRASLLKFWLKLSRPTVPSCKISMWYQNIHNRFKIETAIMEYIDVSDIICEVICK